MKTFYVELVSPVTQIFNAITKSQGYPDQWKIEYGTPIPKQLPVQNEADLRIISKTPFLSKFYESFIVDWLLSYIRPFLDPNQCGGMKGISINHYLIKVLHFAFSILDNREPHAVLSVLVDMSKAFNRVDHNLIIQDLFDMKCPPWLLRIFFSYLSNIILIVQFRDAIASPRALNAGGPQGTALGFIIFIIKFNGACLRPKIPRNMINQKLMSVKFVDDTSSACGIF